MIRFERRRVRTPAGAEWRVGRRWISRSMPRWRKVRLGKAGDAAGEAAVWAPSDIGSLDDLGAAIAILVGVVVVAVVLIPLLLFGIELIILGFVLAAGVLGRGLLGRPWVVQATPVGGTDQSLAWRVVGWRRSGRLIDEVATSLADGFEPAPAEAAERIGIPTGAAAT